MVAAPDSCRDDQDRLKQSRQALLSLDNWLLIRHTWPKAAQGGFDVVVLEQYFPDSILYRLMGFFNSPKEEQRNMYTSKDKSLYSIHRNSYHFWTFHPSLRTKGVKGALLIMPEARLMAIVFGGRDGSRLY